MRKTLILSALILLGAFGCNSKTQVYNDAQNTAPQSTNVTVADYYETGFEGYTTRFDYKITYPTDKYSLEKAGQGFTLTNLSSKAVTKVLFGYNGGIGAQSSAEFWSALNYCKDCKLSSNTVSIQDAKDLKTYTNVTDEWVIYSIGTDYVIIDIPKSDSGVKSSINSLSVKTSVSKK